MIEGAVELKDATDEHLALYAVGKMKLVTRRSKGGGSYLMPATPRGKCKDSRRAYFRMWYLRNKRTELQQARMNGEPARVAVRSSGKKKRNPAFVTEHAFGTLEWKRAYRAFRRAGGAAALPGAGGASAVRAEVSEERPDVGVLPITGNTRAERQRIAKHNWYVRNAAKARARARARYEAKKNKPTWSKPVIREATPKLGLMARAWNALVGWSL